jgi:hypothetical protein
MNQGCVAFLMVFGTCFLCGLEAAGNDGLIQYPDNGQYCVDYFEGQIFRDDISLSCLGLQCTCNMCKDGNKPLCPWECDFSTCRARYVSTNTNSISYDYNCPAGCVSTASCTPVENGYFLSPGSVNGDPKSCFFDCNTGYIKSGYSCVTRTPGTGEYCVLDSYLGCEEIASCTPIANAAFTGPGTEVGNANSCLFECNTGFVKSGSACVCPAGQYYADGKCNACRTCSMGEWLQNCAGSDAGQCVACNNAA